jgi:hypothetical protein
MAPECVVVLAALVAGIAVLAGAAIALRLVALAALAMMLVWAERATSDAWRASRTRCIAG